MDTSKFPGFNQHDDHADDEIDLRQLWLSIYRRKWSIISLTLVVAMLSVLVVFNITPIYKASATLQIENKAANVVSIEQVYGIDGAGSEYLQTQFELLKSRALAERVVRQLSLDTHPEFDPRQQPAPLVDWRGVIKGLLPITPDDVAAEAPTDADIFDGVVRGFRERISVDPQDKTQLVSVSVDMADRATATLAANALADGYIESQLEAKLEMTQTATSWMNDRLVGLKDSLGDSERRLQAFLEQENLVDLQGITTVSANELSSTGERLTDARRERNAAESMYRQVSAIASSNYRRLASVPAVISDPVVAQFKAAEATASARVQELSRRYGTRHPAMVAAQSDLNSARESLKAQVAQVVGSIENNYRLAVANEQGLKSSFEQNKEQIQNISRNEFRLRELQREVETNRSLYDTFMTRLKETTATQDLETVNARVVDRAVMPDIPIKPQKSLIVALAILLALVLGVGLALLLDMLNNTFKGTEAIENKLNLPVLGILPLLKGKHPKVARLFSQDKDKAFAESVRTIRTGLVLSGMAHPYKVMVVTSSVPGEGKTCVSSNLAQALGQMENTLLIDADMRRPTIARQYEFAAGTPGLADLIAGTARLDECVKQVDGISVLPAGMVPSNPLELLSSERFGQVLAQLSEQYDRIIIDTAPTQAVSDALMLARHANAVIYVVKSESTSIPHVQAGVGKLLQLGAPVKGVVLNQLDVKKAAKYGYSYGGYYDDYGYSNVEAKV
ncbi:GumC family protein [Oceanisphaera arctica]|uniref:non-specific protein-tyrosine kinase n=1 Tax=Oceanisphaera arctica TaxID=641510 RepID=A0A2P5TIX2_9GAMM|nr:polysaccharide biosynthesis tyrosine autokinase [Oceanisphaera arctica]PPL14815.1 lipopolysaccharide biosynthesis protein [Oceanisphaera arctica]GHA22972.1 chain-length determining protein [Oceanisphaera arctica]